ACGRDEITTSQVPRSTRAAMLAHPEPAIRQGAEQLFGASSSPRAEVLARYEPSLVMTGDAARGERIYERECMGCHRLGDRGSQLGPNLALTRSRAPGALLEAVLDPNREVQPNYVSYLVIDDSGRTLTGLITAETPTSITLGREKGQTE